MAECTISKKGWDYAEVVYTKGEDEEAHREKAVPLGVLVHTPFEEADYANLGTGS